MSEEEQRIAIAEACGWTCVKKTKLWLRSFVSVIQWIGISPTTKKECELPNYLNDLNAMQDVLLTLPDSDDFVAHLDQFIYEDTGRLVSKMDRVRATAKQLAKAYLTTIEKWKP